MSSFTIRSMQPDEAPEVARLIFESTNAWYEQNGGGPIFQGSADDCLVFTETYEDLDPGCCLVAVEESGAIAASCFYHPRESHVSLGIMNSRPDCRGGAKALLSEIISRAERLELPLRLVSSAFNLDSFSLYTRQGMIPYAVYQDMLLPVPETGIAFEPVQDISVRSATHDDVGGILALEESIWDTLRAKDWRYFLDNERGYWHVSIAEGPAGEIEGAIASVFHPGSNMLGPGLAKNARIAAALIVAELNHHKGRSPVFLVPSDNRELVGLMYQLGARNCELHLGQCQGKPPRIDGVVMPTFLPETA